MKAKVYLSLLVILSLAVFLRIYIISSIHINSLITQPLLFTDLLGKGIIVPRQLIFILDLGNIFLIFLIGKKILNINFGLLYSLIYAILPWVVYLQLFGSFDIFLLFFLLIFFYGVLLLKKKRIGLLIMIISSFVLIYSSLYSWLILPILFFGIYKTNLVNFKYLKIFIITIFIAFLPIVVLSLNNKVGIVNVFKNQVGVFSEPGLKNSINTFRGESQGAGFGYLAKLSENQYIYLSKYVIFKSLKNIILSTYFTPQEKLFNFSFSPPIYFGFLIPFLYGLYWVAKLKLLMPYLFLFVLIIPSILSKQLVDLSHLVLFAPVIILLCVLGIIKLHENRTKKVFNLLLYLSIFLVLLQLIVTLSDIRLREPLRYKLSIGRSLT